jgi:hypothetical protein
MVDLNVLSVEEEKRRIIGTMINGIIVPSSPAYTQRRRAGVESTGASRQSNTKMDMWSLLRANVKKIRGSNSSSSESLRVTNISLKRCTSDLRSSDLRASVLRSSNLRSFEGRSEAEAKLAAAVKGAVQVREAEQAESMKEALAVAAAEYAAEAAPSLGSAMIGRSDVCTGLSDESSGRGRTERLASESVARWEREQQGADGGEDMVAGVIV